MGNENPLNTPPAGLPGPVEAFVKVTCKLTDLIQREIGLLKERRPKEVQALHGEKTRLTAEYKKLLGLMRVNEKALLGDKTSGIRSYVKQVTEMFRSALAEHARMVMRLRDVCQGVVNAIGEEIGKQQPHVTQYGRDARLHGANRYRGPARTMAVDARI